MGKYKASLFVFRRDLRLKDNTALIEACKQSEKVIVSFIFDIKQVGSSNSYRSEKSVQFMIESLEDLDIQIKKTGGKLLYFYGNTQEVVIQLLKNKEIEALFINKDYTPFALNRDKELEESAKKIGVAFHSYEDALLVSPEEVRTLAGNPYTVFTPFYRKVVTRKVEKPRNFTAKNISSQSFSFAISKTTIFKKVLAKKSDNNVEKGGTKEALKLIANLSSFKNYAKTRDIPTEVTSFLAAHNKFGTVSIRDLYYKAKDKKVDSDFIKQLYWREFFTQLAFHFPHVFGKAFREKYQKIKWKNNTALFKKWCEGETGFPFVDAGMRQLNATGYMHNRLRMLVASFLVKNLHCDWRWGEKYFAQKLIDYDPCVNNGSWQWAASTGADAQPYFRIFNPWTQQQKFDPQCEYIKKWVPELEKVEPKIIHAWDKKYETIDVDYPAPCVNHAETSRMAKMLFKA